MSHSFASMFTQNRCAELYRSCGDVVDRSYVLERPIGTGSHAVVWQGKNIRSGELVAMKQLHFGDNEDEKLKRSYREVKLLQHFTKHENIVTLFDLLTDDRRDEFGSIFLVMNLCKTDLHKLLKSSQVITMDHVKLFSCQLIRAVRALHEANVIHRDLKPQNILINTTMDSNNTTQLRLMLCDFGTGRQMILEEQDNLRQTSLNCVTTAFYCAPEGILNKDIYSTSVDIWATGCIIAEMIKRTPLFQGRGPKHQLRLIVDVCGKPSTEELAEFPDSSKKRSLIEYQPSHQETIIDKLPPETEAKAVDLLQKLLVFNPNNRLSAEQAFEHAFLDPFNKSNYSYSVESFEDLETTREQISTEDWKDKLWAEVVSYRTNKENSECTNTTEDDLWGES